MKLFLLALFVGFVTALPSPLSDRDEKDDHLNVGVEMEAPLKIRQKRQSGWKAMNLASSFNDKSGNPRKLFKPHFDGHWDTKKFSNSRDYLYSRGGGLGAVVWKSDNKKHSIGVGGYGTLKGGSIGGHSFKSKPDFGVGLGYQFKFG